MKNKRRIIQFANWLTWFRLCMNTCNTSYKWLAPYLKGYTT